MSDVMSAGVREFLPSPPSDELRRVRINADAELSRYHPGWVCAMFHYGRRDDHKGRERWLMVYSVQMALDSEPMPLFIHMGRIQMADGSTQWGCVGSAI